MRCSHSVASFQRQIGCFVSGGGGCCGSWVSAQTAAAWGSPFEEVSLLSSQGCLFGCSTSCIYGPTILEDAANSLIFLFGSIPQIFFGCVSVTELGILGRLGSGY